MKFQLTLKPNFDPDSTTTKYNWKANNPQISTWMHTLLSWATLASHRLHNTLYIVCILEPYTISCCAMLFYRLTYHYKLFKPGIWGSAFGIILNTLFDKKDQSEEEVRKELGTVNAFVYGILVFTSHRSISNEMNYLVEPLETQKSPC